MTDLTIEREIVIDAPVDVVWSTITEPDQITQWFADRVELDVRPGGSGSFEFEARATHQTSTVPLAVEVLEPPHRFSFRWAHPDGVAPAPGNSVLVKFTLTAEGDERTRLRVIETGLEDLGWSDSDKSGYADEHNEGWRIHLGRLAELYAARAE